MHTGGRVAFGQPSTPAARGGLLRPTVEVCTCRAQLRLGQSPALGEQGEGFSKRGAVDGSRAADRVAWAPPAVRGTGMEPTESAPPDSLLRRVTGAWRESRW